MSTEEIEAVMAEVDRDGDGRLDYAEFCHLLLNTADDCLRVAKSRITPAHKHTREGLSNHNARGSLTNGERRESFEEQKENIRKQLNSSEYLSSLSQSLSRRQRGEGSRSSLPLVSSFLTSQFQSNTESLSVDNGRIHVDQLRPLETDQPRPLATDPPLPLATDPPLPLDTDKLLGPLATDQPLPLASSISLQNGTTTENSAKENGGNILTHTIVPLPAKLPPLREVPRIPDSRREMKDGIFKDEKDKVISNKNGRGEENETKEVEQTASVDEGGAANDGVVKGIESTADNSVEGGAANGMEGGAASGMEGGAASGIEGGAASGMEGGPTNGMEGGAASGMEGGAASGMEGGTANGMEGGAANGMEGGAANNRYEKASDEVRVGEQIEGKTGLDQEKDVTCNQDSEATAIDEISAGTSSTRKNEEVPASTPVAAGSCVTTPPPKKPKNIEVYTYSRVYSTTRCI